MTDNQPTATPDSGPGRTHYQRPGWLTVNVMNRLTSRLTRMGVSLWGSRVLQVRGRVSGQLRSNPVNVLTLDGQRYLVSPRGQTEWVRNLRVAGTGELVLGRKAETFTAIELTLATANGVRTTEGASDELLVSVLRSYLRRWKWEVGQFFVGVGPDSTDEELLSAAPDHPIFAITTGLRS